ncbi:histidine phosphatase family protein [Candidatus Saccharibacteria bacterium]|nr:histidine phosphatase family protein [Candidatus Saccharibacteria bacterium]
MDRLLIRHALSEANNRANYGRLAFANKEALLMPKGILQAQQLGSVLRQEYAVSPEEKVATSTLARTQQTAQEAGLLNYTPYPLLDEVDHGTELPELRLMLDQNQIPETAIEAAERLLKCPPEERIWFTHGLVIAGLSQTLGFDYSEHSERLVPKFCEIRTMSIPAAG